MEIKKWPYIKQVLPWIGLVILELIIIIIMISRLRTKEVEIRYKYIPGDTITIDSILPIPTYIEKNIDTTGILEYCLANNLYLEYFLSDTIIQVIDTIKIIEDWSNLVHYNIDLFDIDTVGKCSIETTVQYNRLGPVNTTFIPIQKVITTRIPRKWEPFVGISFSSQLEGGILAGTYINNWGFSLGYNKCWIGEGSWKGNVSFQVYRKF